MKVTILGAGISGLATAWKLSDKQEVEIIENCGHMILLEEAGTSLELLKKFIRKNHPAE